MIPNPTAYNAYRGCIVMIIIITLSSLSLGAIGLIPIGVGIALLFSFFAFIGYQNRWKYEKFREGLRRYEGEVREMHVNQDTDMLAITCQYRIDSIKHNHNKFGCIKITAKLTFWDEFGMTKDIDGLEVDGWTRDQKRTIVSVETEISKSSVESAIDGIEHKIGDLYLQLYEDENVELSSDYHPNDLEGKIKKMQPTETGNVDLR